MATRLNLVGALVLAGFLWPRARGIGGSTPVRWLALAAFVYVCLGVNNQIEAAIFTTMGGTTTMLLFFIVPAVLCGGAAAQLVKPCPESSIKSSIPIPVPRALMIVRISS